MNNNELLVLCKEGIQLHSIGFEPDEAFEAIHGVFLKFGGIAVMSNNQGPGFLVVKMSLWDRVNRHWLIKTRWRDIGRLANDAKRGDENRARYDEEYHRHSCFSCCYQRSVIVRPCELTQRKLKNSPGPVAMARRQLSVRLLSSQEFCGFIVVCDGEWSASNRTPCYTQRTFGPPGD